jgi:integrase/recombinase XerD
LSQVVIDQQLHAMRLFLCAESDTHPTHYGAIRHLLRVLKGKTFAQSIGHTLLQSYVATRLGEVVGSKRPVSAEMVKRRAAAAGLSAKTSCHSFRATGITAYLENGGTIENAQAIAAHESPRTTKLYDRTNDVITLDEIERIAI